ncbi:MAG: hypothetical protein Pars92KO_16820 [Parasphingorhabdus sp.]
MSIVISLITTTDINVNNDIFFPTMQLMAMTAQTNPARACPVKSGVICVNFEI